MLELLLAPLLLTAPPLQSEGFSRAVGNAEKAIANADVDAARTFVQRALERDPNSRVAWRLLVDWARMAERPDELTYALHRELRLALVQEAPDKEVEALRQEIAALDPLAEEVWSFAETFIEQLEPLAAMYEQLGRPHTAIQIHKEILALDPERTSSDEAIQRLANAPDPSLAEDARANDLLAGISEEWIREFDEKHGEWGDRAKLKRENYVTETDAGYEVLVRCAEAMEQMNAFYRRFFGVGMPGDSRAVPRISLLIFKDRQDFLKKGAPKPEWSGGVFTGSSVEAYVGGGGVQGVTNTLFHEAAHQFVNLATKASGWLNEGLASFFEGCQIQANGSVVMNLPADHRLFPLIARMSNGWMEGPRDGTDAGDPNVVPETAPTFRIVLENQYEWGPAWYAPTWGVVFFLYNYQDPVDGRYVYRAAFRDFVDKTAEKSGSSAIESFEEIVLANPAPPTPSVDWTKVRSRLPLPEDVDELNEVWHDWIVRLGEQRSGSIAEPKPYHDWARYAVERGDLLDAVEFFEKGLEEDPRDAALLADFAELLGRRLEEVDRATKLGDRAIRILEARDPVDYDEILRIDQMLSEWDPRRSRLKRVREELWATAVSLVDRYLEGERPRMAMALSARLGRQLGRPKMYDHYETALRAAGEPNHVWQLAYDEESLRGWSESVEGTFEAKSQIIEAKNGRFDEDNFDFRFLVLERVTSGDYSLEAEVLVNPGEVTMSGLVFGYKNTQTYHSLILFPPREGRKGAARSSYLDLASFFDRGNFKTLRHNPVDTGAEEGSTSSGWHKLRVDVTGRLVDVWFDDELVTTHEYSSRDIVSGRLGLMCGAGRSAYRNVRYLSRPPRDRTAEIERRVRMGVVDVLDAEARDSWLGYEPPWPSGAEWVQEPRTSWDEYGAVPTLVVMWSIRQNQAIPIDGWLRDLARRYEDTGLRFVSVVSFQDADTIEAYLRSTRVPGSVCVDTAIEGFYGDTFELYQIGDKYNLPRLLLLDVDQKCVWEGDPGFKIGAGWSPGKESFLADPLDGLVEERDLREVMAWRERWFSEAVPALRRWDVVEALPLMEEAYLEFGDIPDEAVATAQALYATLERSIANANATGQAFTRMQAEPMCTVLMDCAKAMDQRINVNKARDLRVALKSPREKSWQRALQTIAPLNRKVDSNNPWNTMDEILAKLDELDGPLVAELRADLAEARDAGDTGRLGEILDGAASRPAEWFVRRHLHWEPPEVL